MKRVATPALGVVLALAAPNLYAYQWPVFPAQGTLHDPSPINGLIGEYRDTALTGYAAPCPHFHDGTDVGRPQNTSVFPVVSGTVSQADLNVTGHRVDVGAQNAIFRFVHVVPDAVLVALVNGAGPGGVNVDAGVTVIGAIDGNAHVHLRETDAANTTVQNNLRAGGLENYQDIAVPAISSVELFDADNPGGPLNLTLPLTAQHVKIRARAQDAQSNGSGNVGLYQVGYQVFNADSGALVINAFPNQTYSSFPRTYIGNPGKAYDTTASQGYRNGVLDSYYWAHNGINPNAADTPLNLQPLTDGEYNLCVLAKDIKGNGGNVGSLPMQGATCVVFNRSRGRFLVENRESTFAELSRKTPENLASADLYHRATFSRCIIAGEPCPVLARAESGR